MSDSESPAATRSAPNHLPAPRHDPLAALRERNYRLFVAGWLPASIGLQMQGTALAWEIYERTRDPLALGLVGVARALPTVLLALPAGRIVDLVDRRRVLCLTQLAFTLAGLLLVAGSLAWERGWLGDGPSGAWIIYALVALTGCARGFNGPARASLLPLLLPGGASGPLFQNAITWNSGVFQLAATLGPVSAGGLIAITGQAWPAYAVSAAACLWFAIASLTLRPARSLGAERFDQSDSAGRETPARDPVGQPADRDPPVAGAVWRLLRPSVLLPGILEGVQHIWNEKAVFGAITLDLFAVLLGGATALMPVYASDILHVGPVGLGALRAAPFVGALLMALILAHRPPFRRAGPALLWSVVGFGVCTILFGVSTNVFLSLALLALLGALDNISVVIRHVLVSVRTPDRLRGRVSAVNAVFIESSNELGGFESGLVAKLLGPVVSVVSGGIGTILVVIGMAWAIPELRRLTRLDGPDVAPHALADDRDETAPGIGE